ncbi:MAG: ATP-binding protein [Solirubrobacteraceae bacterium]
MSGRFVIEPPYERRILDPVLDELLAQLPAVAIEGARAVGKTATALQRARSVRQLDEPAQQALAAADLERLLQGPFPVLLDEWQNVPPVWDRVRRAVDGGAIPGSFILTGSSSPRETGTHSGAGRIVSMRLRPMSLAERWPGVATVSLDQLLTGTRADVTGHLDRGLVDYTDEIVRSGFPGIRSLHGRALRAQLDGYLARVVDRDFDELGAQLRNPAALTRWLRAYAAAVATTTSLEKIRAAATGTRESPPAKTTVHSYRDALERLFLLDEVRGWQPSRNQLSQLALAPKHHLADPALAATLLGVGAEELLDGQTTEFATPRDGALLGALFESLITLSIKVYADATEAQVSHFRTRGGRHEADLVVERHGRVVAVEIKLSETVRPDAVEHLNWLDGQLGDDLLDKVVVTTGREAYRRKDGIAVVPAGLLGP